jgi:tellurite resistance protein
LTQVDLIGEKAHSDLERNVVASTDETSTNSTSVAAAPELGGVSVSDRQRRRAQVTVVQINLNRHLQQLGSPTLLATDGKWDDHTDRAFKQVCRVLGVAPERKARTYRIIAGAAATLTDEERARAAADGKAFATELRQQFAQESAGRGLGGTPLPKEQAQRAFIAAVQRDLNAFHRKLRTGTELAVDGEWDEHTERAFRQACKVLGIAPVRSARTYRIIAGGVASRTAEELARAKREGAVFARRLRANGLPPLVVLGSGSMSKDERERAYVATLQNALNQHLVRLGSPAILAVDGEWGKHTQKAFEQITAVLGVKPVRNMRTYRVLGGALAPLTEEERKRAAEAGEAHAKRLREEFALQRQTMPKPKPDKPPPQDGRPPKKRPGKRPDDARLAAAIERHGGRYAKEIIAASRRTGAPVALLCAIAYHETNFRNIYGRDRGRRPNPVRSPDPPKALVVTRENYRRYLKARNSGFDANGVGVMQLTSHSYQDRADKLGGCWRPDVNILVGAEVILEKIRIQGGSLRQGIRAYNGEGEAAEKYADNVLHTMRLWEQRLGTRGAAGKGSGPRTLRVTSPLMEGSDVKGFQRVINKRYADWKVDKRIDVDGKYGSDTRKAAAEVAFGLGIARSAFAKGFRPALRRLMAEPSKRTERQKERARKRASFRRELRRGPDVRTLLRGHPAPQVPALLDVIVEAAKAGLVVTSTTGGSHAAGSYHYRARAVDLGYPGNPYSADGQRTFVRFQHRLARNPRRFAELIGPDVHKNVKNGVFIRYNASTEAAHKNHIHCAI